MREKRDKERFSYYYYTLQQQKEEMDVFKRKKELEKQAEEARRTYARERGIPLIKKKGRKIKK
jgi:hypothetical protein